MVITGLLIKTRPDQGEGVARQLAQLPGLTVYGVHQGYQVITVLEAPTVGEAQNITTQQILSLADVVGAFPTYIHWEGCA